MSRLELIHKLQDELSTVGCSEFFELVNINRYCFMYYNFSHDRSDKGKGKGFDHSIQHSRSYGAASITQVSHMSQKRRNSSTQRERDCDVIKEH